MKRPLKIAVIAGEESGDLLAGDLLETLARREKRSIELIGVGGTHLQALGLKSFFNREDIALMGITEVLKKLPRLILHIYRLTAYFVQEKPDLLLIVDSPDFTHRIARRLRKLSPNIPIVQYVAPSVWAWRPLRAKAMRSYIDLLLVILPFEPQILQQLGGPKSVYVGHRLLSYPPVEAAYRAQCQKNINHKCDVKKSITKSNKQNNRVGNKVLLVLPGSRGSEIHSLMPVFGEAAAELKIRYPQLKIILPTLPHLAEKVQLLAKNWKVKPKLITSETEKWAAFAEADAALAASGTVSLELALCAIPTVLSYKTDWFVKKFILPRITIWSAALPNIIVDEPIIPEYFNEFVRSSVLVRQIECLLTESAARQVQLQGFEKLRCIMQTGKSTGELAAIALQKAEFWHS